MDINTLKQALSIVTKTGGVPFIQSAPGVGKSDTVKQFAQSKAEELGLDFYEGPENYNPDAYGFIDLRLATIDIIDLSGLPIISASKETTQFTRSPYIPKAGHGVIFLDELVQCKPGNQSAVSQLILDKRVGAHALGKNWVIVTAGNRAKDRAATYKMPTHIANRLTSLDLEFSLSAFTEYMTAKSTNEVAIAFAQFRPELLESFDPDKGVNCTPRSFIAAANYIGVSPEGTLEFELMSGTIGEGAASEFIGFTKIYQELPPFEEFIANPEGIEVPKKADVLFATIQMLSYGTTKENLDRISLFISRLSSNPEKQVMYYKSVVSKNPKLIMEPACREFVAKNKEFMF